MRRLSLLILMALASTSQAVKLLESQYSLTANPQQGFKLQVWLTLAAKFPKDNRLLVAEFACNLKKDGALKFRHLNLPEYIWGDVEDEQAVTAAFLSEKQFKVGEVAATCQGGQLVVNTPSAAKLLVFFPDQPTTPELAAVRHQLDISEDVTFSAAGLRIMRVPLSLTNKTLTATEPAAGLAVAVTQAGILKPIANGIKSTPAALNTGMAYTVHVISGKSYNVRIAGGQVTGWVSDKP